MNFILTVAIPCYAHRSNTREPSLEVAPTTLAT